MRKIVLLVAAFALPLTACGPGGGSDGGGEVAQAPIAPPEVSFSIADQGVTEVPEQVQAGINTLTVTNSGKDKHFPLVARVNDGVNKQKVGLALAEQDFETFLTSADFAAAFVTESQKPNVLPGGTGSITVELTEGTYILSDPEAKRFEPGYFEVGPAGSDEIETPPAEYEIVEKDYSIDFPKTIPAGAHTYSLTNAGEQDHELLIMNKKNPDKGAGFVLAPLPGNTEWVTFDLEPGDYIVACHIPDIRDGKVQKKNHAQLGMRTTFTVK